MKNIKSIKQYVVAIVLSLGLVLGASALQADWTNAPASPPSGNVDAPLNVGDDSQSKLGRLILNTNTTSDGPGPFAVGLKVFGKTELEGALKIAGGSPGAGKVLTSDASGNTTWETPSSPSVVPGTLCGLLDYDPGGTNREIQCNGVNLRTSADGVSAVTGTCPSGYTFTSIFYISNHDYYSCVKN